MNSNQRGLSIISLLFVIGILAFLGVIGAQAVPMFTEHQAVVKSIKKAAADESTVQGARASFDKMADINQITSIKGADLDVTKIGEKIVIQTNYEREIHLAAMVYLTFKFQGASTDK